MTQPVVFICYNRKDEKEKDKLVTHLGVLRHANQIELWTDESITPGAYRQQEFDRAINQSKVAVLLVTANFLTSDFIVNNIVPQLLERRKRESLIIFPVIAKACAWKRADWLTRMNVRPKNGRPIWSDSGSHIDEDLARITEEIAEITINFQDAILEVLLQHYNSYQSSQIPFEDLCGQLFGIPSHIQEGKLQSELFMLKKKGMITYIRNKNGELESVSISSEGFEIMLLDSPEKRIKKDQEKVSKQSVTSNKPPIEPCPMTLGELIQKNKACARLLQREDLLHEIKKYLTQAPDPKSNHIVLYGQPMVGKTKFLERLSIELSAGYVPLMITGQGFHAIDNLDAFAFDLADQLTIKFRKWANNQQVACNLSSPKRKDFGKGKGGHAFHKHWNDLRQEAGAKQPIIIFDEIERLLDYPQKFDPKIFTFLDHFVRSPENGYFILAGSENIQYSRIKQFSMLIAKGKPIPVRHYDEETIVTVFSAVQKHFILEQDILKYYSALCDGHPRLLQIVFEATVYHIIKSPDKKKLGKNDLEPILTQVIEQAENVLWALRLRLSDDEWDLVRLISQKASNLTDKLEYSLHELVELTNHSIDQEKLDRGAVNLAKREWIEWKKQDEGLFRLKLGIFPLWVRRHHIHRTRI